MVHIRSSPWRRSDTTFSSSHPSWWIKYGEVWTGLQRGQERQPRVTSSQTMAGYDPRDECGVGPSRVQSHRSSAPAAENREGRVSGGDHHRGERLLGVSTLGIEYWKLI